MSNFCLQSSFSLVWSPASTHDSHPTLCALNSANMIDSGMHHHHHIQCPPCMKKFERTGGLNALSVAAGQSEAYKPRRWMCRELLAEMSSPDPPSNQAALESFTSSPCPHTNIFNPGMLAYSTTHPEAHLLDDEQPYSHCLTVPTCNEVGLEWAIKHWKFWFNEVSRFVLPWNGHDGWQNAKPDHRWCYASYHTYTQHFGLHIVSWLDCVADPVLLLSLLRDKPWCKL